MLGTQCLAVHRALRVLPALREALGTKRLVTPQGPRILPALRKAPRKVGAPAFRFSRLAHGLQAARQVFLALRNKFQSAVSFAFGVSLRKASNMSTRGIASPRALAPPLRKASNMRSQVAGSCAFPTARLHKARRTSGLLRREERACFLSKRVDSRTNALTLERAGVSSRVRSSARTDAHHAHSVL